MRPGSTVLQAHARTDAVDGDKDDRVLLEGAPQLRAGGAMDVVAMPLEVPDRAARHRGGFCEVVLRPVEKSQSGVAERR